MSKYGGNYIPVVQGTGDWLQVRLGKVTASRIADVVLKQKSGKYYAAREDYKVELLMESLTGQACEHFVSPAMDFGAINEPLARTTYEFAASVEVESVGFFVHPTIERSGASPDGLVGDDGMVEIKVPNTTTHLGYLLADVVPEAYKPQMMWQMACTGRKWCDFVSYDPRLPEEFGIFIKRFERDNGLIAAMECEVLKFIGEINEMAERLYEHKAKHIPMPREESLVPQSSIPDAEEWLR